MNKKQIIGLLIFIFVFLVPAEWGLLDITIEHELLGVLSLSLALILTVTAFFIYNSKRNNELSH